MERTENQKGGSLGDFRGLQDFYVDMLPKDRKHAD
jgi:hypothetical protein